MDTRVRILPEDLVNKIAAGEIVERPGNVIKELVENAIDAGATRISVEVKDGGRKIIRVTDNGNGMKDEDLLLAFERHATSKIAAQEDLYRIRTLGFRGEALPSIASVSKMEMFSREKNSTIGNYLRIEGGDLKKVHQVSCDAGTVVVVKDLFYNTPARKKFLKTIFTENRYIAEIMLRYIAGYPERSFSLTCNNRMVVKNRDGNDLQGVLPVVFGEETGNQMIEVAHDAQDYPMRIRGFISRPVLNYPKSDSVYFLVNRRYVRSKALMAALFEGYRGYLMVNRYPACVLNLELGHDLYDINIHPQKLDVRFESQKIVFGEMVRAISGSLTRSHSFMSITVSRDGIETEPKKEEVSVDTGELFAKPKQAAGTSEVSFPELSSSKADSSGIMPETVAQPVSFSQARVIGQFKKSFIICELDDSLLIIDQHAAHEKVLFETLRDMYYTESGSQPLLVPIVKEFPLPVKNALLERREFLEEVGMKIEDFGGSSVKINEIPAFVNQKEIEALYGILKPEFIENRELFKEEMLKTVACHRAVKNGDSLERSEIVSLLKGLEKLKNPFFCPHGRPVVKKISLAALERSFGRT